MAAYLALRQFLDPRAIYNNFYLGFWITMPIALAGAKVSYRETPASFRILLKTIFAFATFYIVTSHVSLPDSILPEGVASEFGLNIGWGIAVLFGALSFFRPSFGLVPLQYVIWQKLLLARTYDLRLTQIDYWTVADIGSFLILGLLVLRGLQWLHSRNYLSETVSLKAGTETNGLRSLEILLLAAVAMHFGNYFYSAILKMSLGPHELFWALENRTQFLIATSIENKVMPLSFIPGLPEKMFWLFRDSYILFNFGTLIGQFICIVAIIRVKWAMLITLYYDLIHISIFILTGIFFWKWIILNFAIVAAFGTFRKKAIPRIQQFFLVTCVLVSPVVFNVVFFGWLDSPALNRVNFYAVAEDGKEYRMSNNYMLGMSPTFQQQRIVWPNEGAIRTWTWGTTIDDKEMWASISCENEPNDDSSPLRYFASKEQITTAMQTHHQLVMSLVDDTGHFEYDLFPHHIWSTPWQFEDFKSLDKRQIVAYRYERSTLCFQFDDGVIQRHVGRTDGFIIPVR